MSDEAERPPRHSQNLQGLLRFAVESTRSEDAPAQSPNVPPMDPERRRFLEQAIASMTVNAVDEMRAAASVLTDANATISDQQAAIDHILQFVDSMDNANDFCKIGGLDIVLPLLAPGKAEPLVRQQCAELVAAMAQNNPFCQQQLLEMNALGGLMSLLSADVDTARSGMHALSSCVRAYEPAAAAFIELNGLECVLGCLRTTQNERMVGKSLFFLRALCSEYPNVKDELIKLNAIETICEHLHPSEDYDAAVHAALSTLDFLTDRSSTDDLGEHVRIVCQEHCRDLRDTLSAIVRVGNGRPECEEAVENARGLLLRLFAQPETDEIPVDR